MVLKHPRNYPLPIPFPFALPEVFSFTLLPAYLYQKDERACLVTFMAAKFCDSPLGLLSLSLCLSLSLSLSVSVGIDKNRNRKSNKDEIYVQQTFQCVCLHTRTYISQLSPLFLTHNTCAQHINTRHCRTSRFVCLQAGL